MHRGTRDELLTRLAGAVGSVTVAHPTRVAIDGPPAAGKTTLWDIAAETLMLTGSREACLRNCATHPSQGQPVAVIAACS